MVNLSRKMAKTALRKASFFSTKLRLTGTAFCVLACALSCTLFCSCGLGTDPDADGARFNKRFYFYYSQTCKYDHIGAYGCEPLSAMSSSITIGLRVDSDGFASLNLDGDRYYYLESEYDEGYDPDYGSYFHFYQNEDELTIYKDGLEMAWWDTQNGIVTYFFRDLY